MKIFIYVNHPDLKIDYNGRRVYYAKNTDARIFSGGIRTGDAHYVTLPAFNKLWRYIDVFSHPKVRKDALTFYCFDVLIKKL